MPDYITSYEFGQTVKRIEAANAEFRNEVRENFARVLEKQDTTNGRINNHDERHFEFMERLGELGAVCSTLTANVKNLNNEVFERPKRDGHLSALPPELVKELQAIATALQAKAAEDATPVITRGGLKKLWAALSALAGAVLWLAAQFGCSPPPA